jgi:hypothetical protein
MATTTVTLGDFVFAGMEVPESLPFGGGQALVVHRLIGGQRVVDAMGPDDAPPEWRGWFLGENALDRARYLDTLRKQGKALTFSYSEFRYLVVIASFTADFQRPYQIPYRISLELVEDLTAPVNVGALSSIDDVLNGDMDTASGLGDLIGDGPLSTLLGGLDTAIRGVSSFANASTAVINGVLAPIAAVQGRVTNLVAGAGNSIQNLGTLGGVLPGTSIGLSSSALATQVIAFNKLPNLYSLQNVVGRMGANLGSVSGSARPVTVSGGNLMDIASSAYGDATSWTGIAKANGLTDPVLTGTKTISVPLRPDTAGGILGD